MAFAGKGGTGKTTLAAIFIRILADRGRDLLAVDCDPDSNLGTALGFKDAAKITPIIKMEELIHERMAVSDGGSFFKLNPKIDDIPDRFSRKRGNIKLIVMGSIKRGGSGCVCPENAFVKNLIDHLVLKRNEDVIMDMEAGVEHFGRGTARGCDAVLVVVEPSQKSLESAERIEGFARDLGIKNILAIANKITDKAAAEYIKTNLKGTMEVIEDIPFSKEILEKDRSGDLSDIGGEIVERMANVGSFLARRIRR